MSIFDVLRYPISDRPTATELNALPKKLFEIWCYNSNWLSNPSVNYISDTYLGVMISPHHDIILLRAMIKEYDESL